MSYRVEKLVIDGHTDTHTQATTIPEGQNWPRVIIIYKLIPWTDTSCAACKIVERWIPQNSIDDKSTLVQVMAWCRQATSHYLSQCWPRSMSPYGVTRPQWVNGVYYTQPQVVPSIYCILCTFQIVFIKVLTLNKWYNFEKTKPYKENMPWSPNKRSNASPSMLADMIVMSSSLLIQYSRRSK